MNCAEWWVFELLAIFAGMLGTHQQAAQVAFQNIVALLYTIPLGVQFAASALVGTKVSQGNVEQAQRYALTSVLFGLSTMLGFILFLMGNQEWVARLLTSDSTDIFYIKSCMSIMSMYLIADTIHGVQTGIVRGLGKQQLASIVTIGSYYIFGLPLALWLCFKLQFELMGFWMGFFIAMIIMDIIIAIVII